MLPLIIIGIAAGFLATRIMRIQTDIPTTVVIGIGGALVGSLVLRSIAVITGMLAGLVGAFLGAMILIWLYKTYSSR